MSKRAPAVVTALVTVVSTRAAEAWAGHEWFAEYGFAVALAIAAPAGAALTKGSRPGHRCATWLSVTATLLALGALPAWAAGELGVRGDLGTLGSHDLPALVTGFVALYIHAVVAGARLAVSVLYDG